MRPAYGDKYTDLEDVERRSFLDHPIAGGMKLVILLVEI